MTDFEETWTEKSFYNKPLRIWLGSEEGIEDESNLHLDIFTAASIGCLERVKEIITMDKSFCAQKNSCGWTAMMYAAHYGHLTIIQFLLEAKASVHVINKQGCNALMIAAMCGNESIVEALIKAGSIVEARDNRDWTALFHAVCTGYHNVVSLLLKYRVNLNSCERDTGMTPLMYAAKMGNEVLVTVLLEKGAATSLTTHQGHTAARVAKDAGFPKVASVITQYSLQVVSAPSLFDGPAAVEARRTEQQLAQRIRCTNAAMPSINNTNIQPTDLGTLLNQLGLSSYMSVFREQDVDLQVFLTLSDQDLKECGIQKLGPRRKMTSAIARWHSNAPLRSDKECAYADKLEVEMQELGLKLTKALKTLDQAKAQVNQENDLRLVAEGWVVEARGRLQECHQRIQLLISHLSAIQHCAAILSTQPPKMQGQLVQPTICSTLLEALTHITGQAEAILKLTDPSIPRGPRSPALPCKTQLQ